MIFYEVNYQFDWEYWQYKGGWGLFKAPRIPVRFTVMENNYRMN